MNLEEQIRLHKSLSQKIEEFEEQKKQLAQSILKAMTGKSLQLGGYRVNRYSRLSIKLTLEHARTLQATKFEESIDRDKIKTLYKNGHPIEGVSELEYIQVITLKDA